MAGKKKAAKKAAKKAPKKAAKKAAKKTTKKYRAAKPTARVAQGVGTPVQPKTQ